MYIFALERGHTTEKWSGVFEENSEQLMKQSCVRLKPLNLMPVMIGFEVYICQLKMVVQPKHVADYMIKIVNNN
jgi:hypothetical protein